MRHLGAALITIMLFAGTVASVATASTSSAAKRAGIGNVCTDLDVAAALKGKRPGDLLTTPQDVTVPSGLLPDVGRLYRVAYATTGPGGSTVASCGLVAVPAGASTISGVVAWAHGTIGLMADCQPSNKPDKFVGPMPAGVGAPTKGGAQKDGALVGMLRRNYAVVATDYPSSGMGGSALQYYVLGVPAAMAVLDSARALTGDASAFGLAPVADDAQLPLVTWGHSQGGGSALWAGQLAKPYLAARDDRTLNLAGVAAEAPASQFTTSPGQPSAYLGNHLGDRDMYNMEPGLGVPFPIGVALFSYVTVSWSQVTNGTAGEFPVAPTTSVAYKDVLTVDGAATAPAISKCCLSGAGVQTIAAKAYGYLFPNQKRFFADPFGGEKVGGKWQGGIDATCARASSQAAAFQEWCRWLQFNMPGPYGVNPYPKLAQSNGGDIVPLYIAQGTNDKIIWCVDNQGAVQGANCLTAQYTHSVHEAYCDDRHYLEVDYFPGVNHFQVPGAAARPANGTTYAGSPLEAFVQGAIGGTLGSKCSVDPDATSADR